MDAEKRMVQLHLLQTGIHIIKLAIYMKLFGMMAGMGQMMAGYMS